MHFKWTEIIQMWAGVYALKLTYSTLYLVSHSMVTTTSRSNNTFDGGALRGLFPQVPWLAKCHSKDFSTSVSYPIGCVVWNGPLLSGPWVPGLKAHKLPLRLCWRRRQPHTSQYEKIIWLSRSHSNISALLVKLLSPKGLESYTHSLLDHTPEPPTIDRFLTVERGLLLDETYIKHMI